jgi:hypothetical protein
MDASAAKPARALMRRAITRSLCIAAFFPLLLALAARAQIVSPNGHQRSPLSTAAVRFLFPEQVNLRAGQPGAVTLHFRVAPGLHINSNAPLSDFLIPTTFSIPAGSGVTLAAATYPAGTLITLPIDPSTKLSVYTGNFAIRARLVSAAGEHLVQAKLHYQACNDSECLPPKTINVAIDVIAK